MINLFDIYEYISNEGVPTHGKLTQGKPVNIIIRANVPGKIPGTYYTDEEHVISKFKVNWSEDLMYYLAKDLRRASIERELTEEEAKIVKDYFTKDGKYLLKSPIALDTTPEELKIRYEEGKKWRIKRANNKMKKLLNVLD